MDPRKMLAGLVAAVLLTLLPGIAYAPPPGPVSVPEPSSLLLFSAGAGALAWWLRKRR